jgi:hypothetical protein
MLAKPSPPEIAERIFADPATTVDEAIAALTLAHERLASVISTVVGKAGYVAMFARSAQKAKVTEPRLEGVVLADGIDPLLAHLRREEPPAIRFISIAVVASFIELLFTLIGSELALRLIQKAWPDAMADSFRPREKR